MIMWTFGEAAMAYDMPGLTKGVRALSFKRLERLILNLYGDDLRRVGPVGTGPADGPPERRSYGLHTAKVSGFPNMLLLAIVFIFDAGDLVDQLTQAVCTRQPHGEPGRPGVGDARLGRSWGLAVHN